MFPCSGISLPLAMEGGNISAKFHLFIQYVLCRVNSIFCKWSSLAVSMSLCVGCI